MPDYRQVFRRGPALTRLSSSRKEAPSGVLDAPMAPGCLEQREKCRRDSNVALLSFASTAPSRCSSTQASPAGFPARTTAPGRLVQRFRCVRGPCPRSSCPRSSAPTGKQVFHILQQPSLIFLDRQNVGLSAQNLLGYLLLAAHGNGDREPANFSSTLVRGPRWGRALGLGSTGPANAGRSNPAQMVMAMSPRVGRWPCFLLGSSKLRLSSRSSSALALTLSEKPGRKARPACGLHHLGQAPGGLGGTQGSARMWASIISVSPTHGPPDSRPAVPCWRAGRPGSSGWYRPQGFSVDFP